MHGRAGWAVLVRVVQPGTRQSRPRYETRGLLAAVSDQLVYAVFVRYLPPATTV